MPEFGTFDTLTPEVIFTAAEEAFNCRFSGVLLPLPSYINRVYEMESADRERFIIKFYRPGRWSRAALLEEHVFTLEAREAEIPVIAPLRLANGSTLGTAPDGTSFCGGFIISCFSRNRALPSRSCIRRMAKSMRPIR